METTQETNPLMDIKSAFDYHSERGVGIKQMQIKKEKYDLVLGATGCKNSDELVSEIMKRFGMEKFEIVILE